MLSNLSEPSSPIVHPTRIRAIIFDMDNTLFDFVAAKQHACQEVAKYLGRDDWEALFSCFINSRHGFESHENIKDYFDLCGLLEECATGKNPEEDVGCRINTTGTRSITDPYYSSQNADQTDLPRVSYPSKNQLGTSSPNPQAGGRIDLPCGVPFTWKLISVQSFGKETSPDSKGSQPAGSPNSLGPSSTMPSDRVVRDNLVADKSLYCNDVFAHCCEIYETEKIRVLEPYPGARETLAELKRRGFPLAVVTDAHNGNAFLRLHRTNLAEFFNFVISYDMTGAKKPAPDTFHLALKKLGTKPSETLLVGDSIRRDIAPAKELGMITAYAAYGDRNIRSRDPTGIKPDIVLNNIRELTGLVL